MEKEKVLEKLTVIFEDILDLNNLVLTEDTSAEDIEEWDSLTHVQLIHAIQKEFGIKFSASEFMSWDSIGDMVESIICKIG